MRWLIALAIMGRKARGNLEEAIEKIDSLEIQKRLCAEIYMTLMEVAIERAPRPRALFEEAV